MFTFPPTHHMLPEICIIYIKIASIKKIQSSAVQPDLVLEKLDSDLGSTRRDESNAPALASGR